MSSLTDGLTPKEQPEDTPERSEDHPSAQPNLLEVEIIAGRRSPAP